MTVLEWTQAIEEQQKGNERPFQQLKTWLEEKMLSQFKEQTNYTEERFITAFKNVIDKLVKQTVDKKLRLKTAYKEDFYSYLLKKVKTAFFSIRVKKWEAAVLDRQEGEEKAFIQIYEELQNKMRPQFKQFDTYTDTVFLTIYNQVMLKVMDRTLNNTITFKEDYVDGYIFIAIKYAFLALPKPSEEDQPIDEISEDIAATEIQFDQFECCNWKGREQAAFHTVKNQLDPKGQVIIEELLKGKKPRDIMPMLRPLGFTGKSAAFADKKNRTFKNLRKLAIQELRRTCVPKYGTTCCYHSG